MISGGIAIARESGSPSRAGRPVVEAAVLPSPSSPPPAQAATGAVTGTTSQPSAASTTLVPDAETSSQASSAGRAAVPAGEPAAGAASGATAPQGDLPGWTLVLSQDFSRDAALGSFAGTYPGWAGYDGWSDTSKHGTYDSASVVSVANGVVDERLHPAGSGARVVALTPPMSSQLYGRYEVRFRADQVPGYKIAWLLWPADNQWSEGELDFPEADLPGRIFGFAHDVTGTPSKNAWYADTGETLDPWHTATMEWSPGQLTYTLDGRSWSTTDPRAIPTHPMRWVLQTETALDGTMPTAPAHVYVDWVAAWSRGG